eukprot:scaffold3761_cov372-Prasinococcus_capsulatus_cf.AAC.4
MDAVCRCCGEAFHCRFCHDEKQTDHVMNRFDTEEMICIPCGTRQPVSNECRSCHSRMAQYYCNICKLFDSSGRDIYHCPFCNICRIGKVLPASPALPQGAVPHHCLAGTCARGSAKTCATACDATRACRWSSSTRTDAARSTWCGMNTRVWWRLMLAAQNNHGAAGVCCRV